MQQFWKLSKKMKINSELCFDYVTMKTLIEMSFNLHYRLSKSIPDHQEVKKIKDNLKEIILLGDYFFSKAFLYCEKLDNNLFEEYIFKYFAEKIRYYLLSKMIFMNTKEKFNKKKERIIEFVEKIGIFSSSCYKFLNCYSLEKNEYLEKLNVHYSFYYGFIHLIEIVEELMTHTNSLLNRELEDFLIFFKQKLSLKIVDIDDTFQLL